MVMEYVAGGELFDYIVKHGKVRTVITYMSAYAYVFIYRNHYALKSKNLKCSIVLLELSSVVPTLLLFTKLTCDIKFIICC